MLKMGSLRLFDSIDLYQQARVTVLLQKTNYYVLREIHEAKRPLEYKVDIILLKYNDIH